MALQAFAAIPQNANLLTHWHGPLDHLPIGVFICDIDGLVTRTTATPLICGESRRPVGEVLWRGLPVRGREVVIERHDGIRLTLLANADPLYDEDGELSGAVRCIQDISAQKRAELREAHTAGFYRRLSTRRRNASSSSPPTVRCCRSIPQAAACCKAATAT